MSHSRIVQSGSVQNASGPDEPFRQGQLAGWASGARWRQGGPHTQGDNESPDEGEAIDTTSHASNESGAGASEEHQLISHTEGKGYQVLHVYTKAG